MPAKLSINLTSSVNSLWAPDILWNTNVTYLQYQTSLFHISRFSLLSVVNDINMPIFLEEVPRPSIVFEMLFQLLLCICKNELDISNETAPHLWNSDMCEFIVKKSSLVTLFALEDIM